METTIDIVHGEPYGTWFSNRRSGIKEIKEVLEQYPDEVNLVFDHSDEDGGGIEIIFPENWWKNPKPPRKGRVFTEEEKRENSERLAKWREEQKKLKKGK